jgi:hypothetical protein
MAEEAAKQKSKLDRLLLETKRVETENQFLKQDLTEEGAKVKDLQRNLKGKEKASKKGVATTPKNAASLPFRDVGDAFDEEEIAVPSPSKSGRRSKRGTPSAGAKRKRRVTHDSPIPALELTQPRQDPEPFDEPAVILVDEPIRIEELPPIPRSNNQNFHFMQRMLNHRTTRGQERILEAFTNYTFPSEPDKTLLSLLIERTAALSPDNYPASFTRVVIGLWKQCLEEKYHGPIPLLVNVVNFVLALDSPSIAPHIIDILIPVVHESSNINGVPRFKNFASSQLSPGRFFKPTPKKQLDPLVNATEAMKSLYAAATGCLHEEISLRLFWQVVQFDFILMMLNSSQPIEDITINLNLLATSIFPSTFGPILATAQDQVDNENYIIERIACLLMEKPVPDEGVPFPSMTEICELRIEALSLLSELALGSAHPHHSTDASREPHHGSLLLARHTTCLARLFRSMYDELEILYTDPPTANLHCILINNITRLVYRIFKLHPDQIDMKPKWGAVPGGVQKQLIVLSRLAFSEGPWLERGIDEEVTEMAHELLEEVVNLEEASMIVQAFPHMTRPGTMGSANELQNIDEDEEMAAADADSEL